MSNDTPTPANLITCERCGRTTTDPDLWDPEIDTGRIFCDRCWDHRNEPAELTDEQVLAAVNRYHEIARGNGALELVASEIAGHGLAEIVDEVRESAVELGIPVRELSPAAYRKLSTAVQNYGTRLAAELAASKLEEGERVRIVTASEEVRLGAMVALDETKFIGTVTGGTIGSFRGMHPSEQLSGWALVDVRATDVTLAEGWTLEELGNPETFVVPVHASAVERVQ